MPTSDHNKTPQHVAIIMDGNGRWAQKRGLTRNEGHRNGAENVRRIADAGRELGLRTLTLYSFSSENWSRPKDEVGALMKLLEFYLKRELKTFVKNKIRLRSIGRIEEMPDGVQKALKDTIEKTKEFNDYTLVLALNYGSRTEVVDAARAYAADVQAVPDPELIIRTSGEERLSNFMLMQGAYSELVFSPLYWPDFDKAALVSAIETYHKRERRFGLTGEQVKDTSKV